MRASRLVLFMLTIAVGLILGVLYGWVIRPGDSRNLDLTTLSEDYKTDYVLMTAEVYGRDGNLAEAIRRLALVDKNNPDLVVAGAVLHATDLGYVDSDMQTLAHLSDALRSGLVPTDSAESTP